MFNSKQKNAYEQNRSQYRKKAKISKTWNLSVTHDFKLKAVSKFRFHLHNDRCLCAQAKVIGLGLNFLACTRQLQLLAEIRTIRQPSV